MTDIGRLLFPAIRWSAQGGFQEAEAGIADALRIGVGGFSIFGGEAQAVAELTTELRRRSPHPLLIASDLERGAGQQFRGATPLPPLAAIGALDDVSITRRAAAVTAREALALGVNWIYAPVADVDLEPRNPIVGSRAFHTDPETVARHVAAWIRGCNEQGAICCAKHFPGHGRTVEDSHARLPSVTASRDELDQTDLKPFRAAVHAGVDTIMTAHVSYPALDPNGQPATLSSEIVANLLRRELGFAGLIVTDALIMEGVLGGGLSEGDAAVAAVAAGCDALLYPRDLAGVAAALDAARGTTLIEVRAADAIERISAVAARTPAKREGACGTTGDHDWAVEIGARSLINVRGNVSVPAAFDLLTIDDDVGGPFAPPPRDALVPALRAGGLEVREVDAPAADRPLVIALYSDIRAWKSRPGPSDAALERLHDVLERRPDAPILLFGHPRIASALPGEALLAAWGGEAVMQEAAARRLTAAD